MAKPTERWFQESDLLEDAIGDTAQLSGASFPSPDSGGVLRSLLPPLFTVKPDNVNFNMLKAGQYDPASYYLALDSSDTVVLPISQAQADAIGYDPMRTFQAGLGNDTVTGGGLNDVISGGHGNDRLYGNNGNDFLVGGEGNDWLTAAKGNDFLWAGNGIDYIDAGAGNDIIVANDDDGLDAGDVLSFEPPRTPGGSLFRDHVDAGAGDDHVVATHEDFVIGGSGNDRIELSDCTDAWGYGTVIGGNGDDIIVNSADSEVIFISTGDTAISTYPSEWTPANKAAYGGFNDTVIGGAGNDVVTTMQYCNATVETGRGNDTVYAVGLHDLISTGDDFDVLHVFGGACKADLGDGGDLLVISRGTYDNPNVSEITLGGAEDYVWFNMNEWRSISENKQPLSTAPWILDFHPDIDWIRRINLTNVDDSSLSLRRDCIYVFDIEGGSALYYDDPAGSGSDFCFARFAGVSALALQEHVNLYTEFV